MFKKPVCVAERLNRQNRTCKILMSPKSHLHKSRTTLMGFTLCYDNELRYIPGERNLFLFFLLFIAIVLASCSLEGLLLYHFYYRFLKQLGIVVSKISRSRL